MSPTQQYLNSTDMMNVANALARVRAICGFEQGSASEQEVAAIMVGEFQLGNATEDGLFEVFRRPSDPAMHAERKHDLILSLQRWENEGGSPRSPT